jgi:hypothetical protein
VLLLLQLVPGCFAVQLGLSRCDCGGCVAYLQQLLAAMLAVTVVVYRCLGCLVDLSR